MTTDVAPTSVTLRAAEPDDWRAIAALLTDADLPLAGAEERLSDFIVVEGAGGTLLGCGALERYMLADGAPASALLRSLAVAPAARGLGLGALLVERLLATVRESDVADVTLLTTTAADYFPRFGFQTITREQAPLAVRASVEFREACPTSATVMLLAR